MLLQMTGLPFLRLNSIPLCIYALSHEWMHVVGCIHLWLWQIRLLWHGSTGVMLTYWLQLLGSTSRSRIAGPYGISIFRFSGTLHSVFHNGFTNLNSHQQYSRVPSSLHPHQHMLLQKSFLKRLIGQRRGPQLVTILRSDRKMRTHTSSVC
jgi:hypothetical protein